MARAWKSRIVLAGSIFACTLQAQVSSSVRANSFEVGGFVGASYGIDDFRVMGGGNVTLTNGRLADLAPTMLALMELPQPKEMTGASLLRKS